PVLDQVDAFIVQPRQPVTHVAMGDTLPFSQRPLEYRNFLLPIDLAGNDSATLYLRVQTEGSLQVPLALWQREYFFQHQFDYAILQGWYFGIMFVMVLYHLFIYLTLRDTNYLTYTVFVAFIA